jgi:hypothetical protein
MTKVQNIPIAVDRTLTDWLSAFDIFAQRHPRPVVALLVGFAVWFLSIFLYAPPLWQVSKLSRLADFLSQSANPLTRHLAEPILAYRITTPVIAWILQLRGLNAFAIQYVAHIFTFSIIYLVLERRAGRSTALLTCLAISLTYVTQWPNTHPGYSDAVTHLAIAITLFSPNFGVVALSTILGMLNDERFVLAMPFVFFWHAASPKLMTAIRENVGLLSAFLIGLFVVSIVRHALTVGWIGEGIVVPKLYSQIVDEAILQFRPFGSTWSNFFISVLLSFRWVWILPLIAFTRFRKGDPPWLIVGTWGCVFLAVLSAVTVWDVARSIAFIFPVVVTSVWWIDKNKQLLSNRLLASVIALCIVTPGMGYYGGVNKLRFFYPLPLVLIRTYLI